MGWGAWRSVAFRLPMRAAARRGAARRLRAAHTDNWRAVAKEACAPYVRRLEWSTWRRTRRLLMREGSSPLSRAAFPRASERPADRSIESIISRRFISHEN